MYKVSQTLDLMNERFGQFLALTPLAMIFVQFFVVILVYVFGRGSIQLQESLQYINAMMFLGGVGYTALKSEHVRVDVFHAKMSKKKKAIVELCGNLFLTIPFLILFWSTSLPYITDSWSIKEASVEASGLPYVYLLKSTLILFAASLSLSTASDIIKSLHILRSKKH